MHTINSLDPLFNTYLFHTPLEQFPNEGLIYINVHVHVCTMRIFNLDSERHTCAIYKSIEIVLHQLGLSQCYHTQTTSFFNIPSIAESFLWSTQDATGIP